MTTYKSLSRNLRITTEPGDSGFNKAKISSSGNADQFCRQFFYDDLEIYESFFLILLNQANNTIGYVKISQGGVAGTVVDLPIIAKYAVETLARAVILCHNHPSGNTQPSKEDLNLTQKVQEGLRLFDINVLDHIILTTDSFYSFADEGRL